MAQKKGKINNALTVGKYKEPAMAKRPYQKKNFFGPRSTFERFHYMHVGKYPSKKTALPTKFKVGYGATLALPYVGAAVGGKLMNDGVGQVTGRPHSFLTGREKTRPAFKSGARHSGVKRGAR